ncbi:MAG: hypothetical protein M3R01_02685 [Actinomycetota bacterium]|nr:hypothetical protein [Acidimicrobiia bacterium]MDQ3145835.1 hypothetical protein [Actinomycetota bacterium]
MRLCLVAAAGSAGLLSVDPCSLITADDASAIVGTEHGEGTSAPFEASTSCI